MASLIDTFLRSVEEFPRRDALRIGEEAWTYERLGTTAASLLAAIGPKNASTGEDSAYVAILGYRSIAAYAGVVAALLGGRAYMPLNPRFPVQRNRRMLQVSGASTVIVGEECMEQLVELLEAHAGRLRVVHLHEMSPDLPSRYPRHTFVRADRSSTLLPRVEDLGVQDQEPAYLLFTSGSTGTPKGIAVSHGNARAYVDYVTRLYEIGPDDRLSQTFDMTFDLSVHDMFVTWSAGACLFCVPESARLAPAWFIADKGLTVWFSVPSVAMMMSKMRVLKPGRFPTLRLSLFCGEALPEGIAEEWQSAAPDSVVENLYGPTEATIAITRYTWDPQSSPDECVNGIVPIGRVFPDHRASLLPAAGETPLPGAGEGELCVTGPQVTSGYLNNPAETRDRFVQLPGQGEALWYRTGDWVRRDETGRMYFLGRMDHQVKVHGYRVELQEVERVMRNGSGTQSAVAVAWPVRDGHAEGIMGFVAGRTEKGMDALRSYCAIHLPPYMVPSRIIHVDRYPLNANGKIDRRRLTEGLDQGVYR